MIAFLLAASSVLYFAPYPGAVVLGAACLVCSAACYAAAFSCSANGRKAQLPRLCSLGRWPASGGELSVDAAAVVDSLSGPGRDCGYRFGDRLTLRFHGMVFFWPLRLHRGCWSTHSTPWPGVSLRALRPGLHCVGVRAGLLCSRQASRPEGWPRQLLHLATAALAVCALAGLLVHGLSHLVALRITPRHITLPSFARSFSARGPCALLCRLPRRSLS